MSSSTPKQLYLAAYNASMAAAWSWVVFASVSALASGGYGSVWGAVGGVVKLLQAAAALEILHAAVGLVRSNPVSTAMQVLGRGFFLFALASNTDGGKYNWGFALMATRCGVCDRRERRR